MEVLKRNEKKLMKDLKDGWTHLEGHFNGQRDRWTKRQMDKETYRRSSRGS